MSGTPIKHVANLLTFASGIDGLLPDGPHEREFLIWNQSALSVDKASLPAPMQKHLEGRHDQSTHGRRGNVTVNNAGNGYSAKQIVYAQKGVRDAQVQELYLAQDILRLSNNSFREPAPVCPRLKDFPSHVEYSAAYDQYSAAHDEWAQKRVTVRVSDAAQKHLDGSRAGVIGYVNEVIRADWFVERFGDGGNLPPMKISVLASKGSWAGRHEVGVAPSGKAIHNLKFDKTYSQSEDTILHELAHYATSISQTGSWAGHGPEFAGNYSFLVEKMMGAWQADLLKISYKDQGVKF